MGQNPFNSTTSGLVPNANLLGAPGAITVSSQTSQAVGVGSMSFQVQPQCAFAPGMFVSVVNQNNNAVYMVGVVTSYSGTTLVINSLASNGSGSYAGWSINLSGPPIPTAPNPLTSALQSVALPNTSPTIDASGANYSLAAGASFGLAAGSGLLIATEYTYGSTALILLGGSSVSLVGQSKSGATYAWAATSTPSSSQIGIYYSSGYIIKNGAAAACKLGFAAIRTNASN